MEQAKKKAVGLLEWAEVITASLVAIALIFTFLFRLVDVEGTSMNTTLNDNERLVLSCLPYTPQRGDIVVISRGEDQEPLIKRVIAVEGDTIRIDEATGDVYLNGELLEEPYIHVPTAVEEMTGTVTVGQDQVFVMGDNRTSGNSLDSRSPESLKGVCESNGCFDTDLVIGKVVFRVAPISRFGGLYDKS